MGITINGGSNTIGGLAVGGLPDGTVNATTLADNFDDSLQTNMAVLGFKVAANGSLAKYSLADQVIDEYEDASGIDASSSTNETLSSGVYYGSGAVGTLPTGGTVTTYTSGGKEYKLHTFTSSGNFVCGAATTVDGILMVGGGGAGAGRHSGGGGGGEVLYGTTPFSLSAATYAIVIGGGGTDSVGDQDGTGVSTGAARSGQDTTFNGVTANGGGGGGNYGTISPGATRGQGADGGSGGGSAGGSNEPTQGTVGKSSSTKSNVTSPFVATAYGNGGGIYGSSDNHDGGGGGGAGSAGGDASSSISGQGGAGIQINDFNSSHYWAGGGGGAGWNSNAAAGGIGGGGGGATNSGTDGAGGGSALNSGAAGASVAGSVGGNAGANTGGGGGGGHPNNGTHDQTGGHGGSGIVMLKVPTQAAGADLTLQSTATTASSAPSKADLVVLIEDAAGTATLNTDIKGYISRDGSAFSSAVTFVNEGSWGTNKKILAAHDVDISGIASGTSMKYKITTHNQGSGTKETKIHATSLGWK